MPYSPHRRRFPKYSPDGMGCQAYSQMGGARSSLLTDLVPWWNLDEETGTRVDAAGSNDLTDVNTVGFAAGKIGNAASYLEANSESLTFDSGAGNEIVPVGGGASFAFSFWTYMPTSGTEGKNLYRGDNGADATPCFVCVRWIGLPRLWFYLYADSPAASVIAQTDAGDGLVADAWNHCVFWSPGDNKIYASLNNNTPVVSTALAGTVRNFRRLGLGNRASAPFNAGGDTLLDLVGIWSRVLTSDERTALYNGGAGSKPPF